MSNVTEAEITKDIGDYRYFVTRVNQQVNVTRQLLSGKNVDPGAKRVDVPKVPKQLIPLFRQL